MKTTLKPTPKVIYASSSASSGSVPLALRMSERQVMAASLRQSWSGSPSTAPSSTSGSCGW
eukprot:1332400-Pyramimonas_sp.AAC.1